jgi:hypothetical protein
MTAPIMSGPDNPLTGEKALTLLRQVANAEPDRVALCTYVQFNQPQCIVGRVLVLAGYTVDQLSRVEGKSAGQLPDYLVGITESAGQILDAAQKIQDADEPWGEALRAAEAEAGRRGVVTV